MGVVATSSLRASEGGVAIQSVANYKNNGRILDCHVAQNAPRNDE